MRLARIAAVALLGIVLVLFISGCNWTLLGCDLSTPTYSQADFESMRQQCVDKINEYRSSIGVSPVVRSKDIDSNSDWGVALLNETSICSIPLGGPQVHNCL